MPWRLSSVILSQYLKNRKIFEIKITGSKCSKYEDFEDWQIGFQYVRGFYKSLKNNLNSFMKQFKDFTTKTRDSDLEDNENCAVQSKDP